MKTERGEAKVYRAGEKAYLDSFGGMIKCVVVSVDEPGIGYAVTGRDAGKITVKLTVTRGGYARGELLTMGASQVVPRAQHYYRRGIGRINSLYAWQ